MVRRLAGRGWAGSTGRRWSAQPRPWVEGVRAHPAPFWAMESLLHEYPISTRRGAGADAAGRGAAARARCRDGDRAHGRPARPRRLRRQRRPRARTACWPACRPARSRCPSASCPKARTRRACCSAWARRPWSRRPCARCNCSGASSCSAARSPKRWARRPASARRTPNLRFSYDMLGEGARTERDAQRYLAVLPRRDRRHRGRAHGRVAA